jgi:carbamate kinase
MIPDKNGYRWAVPSPEPRRIMEIQTIRLLVDHDIIVVCSGGGGIPVVTDDRGGIRGVEAVIDKDLSAAMLADALGADLLLILTDVDAVYRNWGTKRARRIRSATPGLLRGMRFAAGSMGPKVEAACRFANRPGRWAAIGALQNLPAILDGKAGTAVRPDAPR